MNQEQEAVEKLLQQATEGDSKLASLVDYRLVRELGRGGIGAVFLIENEETNDKTAIKVILHHFSGDDRIQELFKREIANCCALRHPNIVQSIYGDEIEETFFLLMEFCAGGDLHSLLESRQSPLLLEEAMSIMVDILEGLEYAHNAEIPYVELADGGFTAGRGLVHRDFKPSNILLVGKGENRVAKVSDLGFAKAFGLAGLSGMTRTGTVAGTPHFMPRQQLRNYKYAQPNVDIWAAAACLYMMLTRATPRAFPLNADPLQVVRNTKPIPIHQRDPRIPEKLAQIIDYALDDHTELHFADVSSFRSALEVAFKR